VEVREGVGVTQNVVQFFSSEECDTALSSERKPMDKKKNFQCAANGFFGTNFY
jgi:hypothetical protein